jgi:hypothetical protein
MVQIPQYTRGLITKERAVTPVANPQAVQNEQTSIATVLDPLAKFATAYQQKLEKADAETKLNEAVIAQSKSTFDIMEQAKKDYKNNPNDAVSFVQKALNESSSTLESSLPSMARDSFRLKAAVSNESSRQAIVNWSQSRKVDQIKNTMDTNFLSLGDYAATLGKSGGDHKQLVEMINNNLANAYAILPEDAVENYKIKQTQNIFESYWKSRITSDPTGALKQIDAGEAGNYVDAGTVFELRKAAYNNLPDIYKVFGTPAGEKPSVGDGSAEWNIGNVLQLEGGFNANDGGSGYPVIYGINQKWWPEQFAKAKKITDEKGEAAGKIYAEEFYRKEYWDKYNLESLPPETRGIVLDGLVNANHLELIDAAKSGKTPEQLLQMRKEKYQKIAQQPGMGQNLNSWMNRLASQGMNNVGAQYPDKRAMDNIINDPVLAMQQANIGQNVSDLVEWQNKNLGTPKDMAKVLSSVQAETISQKFGQAKDVDEFLSLSRELGQQYGQYTENAVSQIIQTAKLPDTQQVALRLAVSNEAKYRRHIEMLQKSDIKSTRASLDAGKDVAAPSKEVDNELNSLIATNGVTNALFSEGFSTSEIEARLNSYKVLAYSYKLANPNASAEDAAKFALEPVFGENSYQEFNGGFYRVPPNFMDDAETINNNLPDVIKDTLEMYVQSGLLVNPIQRGGTEINLDDVRVKMTDDKKGLLVTSADGRLFIVNGKPLRIDYAYLLNPIKSNRMIEGE